MEVKTILNKWHYIDGIYTRDSWEIPIDGTEIWCTGWPRGQAIKPYGDGMHVFVGLSIYHNDQIMGILDRWVSDGHTWGIEGIRMTREQKKNGYWERMEV